MTGMHEGCILAGVDKTVWGTVIHSPVFHPPLFVPETGGVSALPGVYTLTPKPECDLCYRAKREVHVVASSELRHIIAVLGAVAES